MKHTILAIACLLTGLLMIGCPSRQDEAAEAQRDLAKSELKQAVMAARGDAYAQKAEFVSEMQRELAGIREEMDRLSAKVEAANHEAKADAQQALAGIREKWTEANRELDRAETATESTWSDVKARFKKSHAELKDSFNETRQWLSEKIAP